jgi:alpha-1,3-fucosyltransferase
MQGIAEPENKVILFWTPYYNQSDFAVGFGRKVFVDNDCKFTNCITTADRNLLEQSDAVIFHGFQVDLRDLPAHRHPDQRFIFFLYETIPNTSIPCVGKCLPVRQYKPHYFNWTMTHRRDSDVYVAEQYGAINPKHWTFPTQLPDELSLPDSLPANPADLLNRNYPQMANKTQMVAWFASHCPTHSQREDYVKELSKFVQVDIYGKCGTMECLPRNSQRCENLLDTYKFYLAAENSLCPDYVSEKFYRALAKDIVPIVYGGADYTQYAPPHSFINIADFKSPKDLAAYLKLLDGNDALYLEYFQWKKHYDVVRKPKKGWCDLCAKLNDPNLQTKIKSYDDVAEWWVRKLPCYPGSSFLTNHA